MLKRALAAFLSASFLINSAPVFAAQAAQPLHLELQGPWRQAAGGLSRLSGLPEPVVADVFGPIADQLSAAFEPTDFSTQALDESAGRSYELDQQLRIALAHIDPDAVDAAIKAAVRERAARLDPESGQAQLPALLAVTDAAALLYKNPFALETSRTLRAIQREAKAEKAADEIHRFKLINALAAGIDGTGADAVAALPPEFERAPIALKRPDAAAPPAVVRPDLAGAHNPTQLLDMILSGPDIEVMAPFTHDVGWKAGKDKDLADASNPFVGYAQARIKVTDGLKAAPKAEIEALVGRAISDEKYRAIQTSPAGKDITHPLYMPFSELVAKQADGGTRSIGQNSLSLMVLALHLADKRASDIRTWDGLKRVLRGYIDGSDTAGLAELAKDAHIEFTGGQLMVGERGYANRVKNLVRVDELRRAMEQGGIAALKALLEPLPDERVIPARADSISFGSLTPAVQALDLENVLPAAKWLLDRIETLFESRHQPHELFGLLGMGPKEIEALRVLQGSLEIERLRARQSEFRGAFEQLAADIGAIKKSERSKAEKSAAIQSALWTLARRFGVEKLEPEQLAMLFYAFKDASLFADMAKLYEESDNKAFQSSQVVAELYAVALHKSGSVDEAEKAIRKLMKEGKASSETAAILAKVYKLRHDDLAQTDPAAAQAWLQRSIDTLEQGFLLDFYYYPGINLVYNLFTQGVETNDPAKFERARWVAELVHIASRKAGGERSSNYWVIGTLLEASVILGRDADIDNALPQVLRAARVDWEVDATLKSLRTMRAQIASLGERVPEGAAQLARFDRVIAALDARREEIVRGAPSTAAAASDADFKAARLFEVGTYFGEISSNFAPGTIEYGGQMHSQLVNGWDLDVGREYLRHLGLLDAPKGLSWDEEVERVNERLDEEIRARLGTDKLQDATSAQHHGLDEDAKSWNDAMGVAKGVDSRTNIMVDYFMGRVGESEDDHGKLDCRPHARLKQLLFDIWKAERANAALADAHRAKLAGDEAGYAAATRRADRIARTFMLTFNSNVQSQLIKIHGHSYAILMRRDETGVIRPVLTPLSDAEPFKEAHTYNAIVELDESGALASFILADSFYHWPYRLGGRDPATGRYGIRVPLADISVDGHITVRGAISAHSATTGETVSAGATLVPADWSVGGQQKQVQAVFDELGQPRFRGILIGGLPVGEGGRPDVSVYFDPKVADAVGHLAARMRHESAAAVREALRKGLERLNGLDTVADLPPAIEQWRGKIAWLAKQEGIPATDDNLNAILSMLKVAPVLDRDASGEPYGQHQIVVKPDTDPSDPYGFAALLVANGSRPYIDRHRPYVKHWKIADRLARSALQEVDPARKITDDDVDHVLDHLDIATIAHGRGHYQLQLAN